MSEPAGLPPVSSTPDITSAAPARKGDGDTGIKRSDSPSIHPSREAGEAAVKGRYAWPFAGYAGMAVIGVVGLIGGGAAAGAGHEGAGYGTMAGGGIFLVSGLGGMAHTVWSRRGGAPAQQGIPMQAQRRPADAV